MANQNKKSKFTCFNCNQLNYYNHLDYTDKEKGKELLLEMKIFAYNMFKTKKVIIPCSNATCKKPNSVTITYL